jgi:hypothetical protein
MKYKIKLKGGCIFEKCPIHKNILIGSYTCMNDCIHTIDSSWIQSRTTEWVECEALTKLYREKKLKRILNV